MRLGFSLPQIGPLAGPDAGERVAQSAEQLGYESRRSRMVARIAALGVAALAAGSAHVASSETLTVRGDRLYVPITINGLSTEALLDSAAEITFVDPALAAELKLEPDGSETAKGSGGPAQIQFAKGVDIEAAAVKLNHITVALLDMTDLSKRLVGEQLRVILGREVFDAARLRVDIEGGTIRRVETDAEPRGVRLPLTSERGIESVPCKIEGVETQADVDLGNGSDVLIGKAFAERHGLLAPGRVVERKEGGGIGGSVLRDIVVLSTLEVAGVKFENVRAAIDPQPTAGEVNIGTRILRAFVLTIDFRGHAVWFAPN